MRLIKIVSSVAVLVCLTLAPLHASPKGPKAQKPTVAKSSQSKAPKVTTVSQSSKAPKAPKAPQAAAAAKAPKAPKAPTTTAAAKADAKAAKIATKTAKAEAKADVKAAKAESKLATAETTATTSETGDGTTPTPAPSTIDFTSGPVGEKLTKNTKLRSKIETRLQAAGYEGTVYQAAYGFRNLGQFVAATNVSQHTGIPFEQLRIQMTGYSVDATGTVLRANVGPDGTVTLVAPADATMPAPTLSLGQSIQTLKPTVDATAEAQSATVQADAEIAASTVSN
jgi:hypothetical protein